MPLRTFQGSLDAADLRIGIVVSRFNEFITEQLAKGALDTLEEHGCRGENISFVIQIHELGSRYKTAKNDLCTRLSRQSLL